ncbi:hypothetical protein BDV96DRAFT_690299 [Lophiotrema nucula]|uniref:Uncharacterized protein n=1 Tax=Lophiotrema nucula TaxID=690887 RepID=A0A6A5YZ50_9PLEO|nr:hypothetical protein BDV96DRAFT_690299 [Lophiotrema nucula]
MVTVPSDEDILKAIRDIYASTPDLGRAKVLAKLKGDNTWQLSDNRLKKLLDSNDLKRILELPKDGSEIPVIANITIPKNALAAQIRYKDESIRCFKLYGKGEYDWGVTPNSDMQIMIEVCHNRLLEWGAAGPWSATRMRQVASSSELRTIWEYYWSAAQKVGLTKDDIGRQLKAEYGADPTNYIPSLTPAQEAKRKAEFKKNSMAMKRQMLKHPEGRKAIRVDTRGDPLWDEEINGQFVVIVTRINKGDGLTEYGDIRGPVTKPTSGYCPPDSDEDE